MLRSITCNTSFEGIHCWPDAPEEVKYLRDPHRHIFKVTVTIDVKHNDREIEFIMVKHHVDRWIRLQCDFRGIYRMGSNSCEDTAELIIQWIESRWPHRKVSVSVFEDGENGCTLSNS